MNITAIKGLLGIFVVLLAGTAALFVSAVVEQDRPRLAPVVIEPLRVATATATQPTYIGETRAVEIAQNLFKGTVTEVKLNKEKGIYEVEIEDHGAETEVRIDAITGVVLGTETEVKASDVGPMPISEEEAIAIAREVVTRGTLVEVELESETGVLVYAVEFIDGDIETEVLVDMETGSVIGIEHERADDDD